MKYIERPGDITLTDPATGHRAVAPNGDVSPPRRFESHVVECWLSDPRMGTSLDEVDVVQKLYTSVRALKAGDVWDVEDADYKKLEPIVRAPQNCYPSPLLNMQVTPFQRAFLNAKSEKSE
jgi:hypothetical protein